MFQLMCPCSLTCRMKPLSPSCDPVALGHCRAMMQAKFTLYVFSTMQRLVLPLNTNIKSTLKVKNRHSITDLIFQPNSLLVTPIMNGTALNSLPANISSGALWRNTPSKTKGRNETSWRKRKRKSNLLLIVFPIFPSNHVRCPYLMS